MRVLLFVTLMILSTAPLKADPLPSSEYILFHNTADANHWAEANASFLRKSLAAQKFVVLENDPRTAVLQTYIHEIWRGFTELFPEETRSLNEPPVVLAESEIPNAFVSTTSDQTQIAHAIIATTALLQPGAALSMDAISGLMAHELTHSVFKHSLLVYRDRVTNFFDLRTSPGLAYQAPRDASLNKTMNDWVTSAFFAGPFTSDTLMNLPSLGWRYGVSEKLLWQIEQDLVSQDPRPVCRQAEQDLTTWKNFFVEVVNDADSRLEESQPQRLQAASAELLRSLQNCLQGKKTSFTKLAMEAFQLPASKIGSLPGFDQAPTAIDGLTGLTAHHREIMKSIEKSLDFANVRSYTHEQHADEISVLVMAYLGKNPLGIAEFLQTAEAPEYKAVPAGYKALCDADLRSGNEPAIGHMVDAHHSVCYRIYEVRRLVEVLPTSAQELRSFIENYRKISIGENH